MNDSKLTVEVQRGVIGIAAGFRNNLNTFSTLHGIAVCF